MGRVFDEFEIGQRFVTPGRTITEGDIGAFAGLTGDYNPVHTDETFAAATDFGSRIAHGPMGIGMAFGLASRLDLIDGTAVALLGVIWDFKAPMRDCGPDAFRRGARGPSPFAKHGFVDLVWPSRPRSTAPRTARTLRDRIWVLGRLPLTRRSAACEVCRYPDL